MTELPVLGGVEGIRLRELIIGWLGRFQSMSVIRLYFGLVVVVQVLFIAQFLYYKLYVVCQRGSAAAPTSKIFI